MGIFEGDIVKDKDSVRVIGMLVNHTSKINSEDFVDTASITRQTCIIDSEKEES